MRIGATVVLLAALAGSTSACGTGDVFRQYEYEEEIYLALDGSATIYVNGSVAALDALRGAAFETDPSARIEREAVRDWFTTPVTRVTRTPSLSRRSSRRFAHVRLDVDDIARLSDALPFAWSSYRFAKEDELFVYRQTDGRPTGHDVGDVGWTGQEIVAFRLHLPSTIVYHNAGQGNPRRGNILVWEQRLQDRLRGEPLAFEARIEAQSILSRTLLLFGATFIAVVIMFGLILWRIVRHAAPARS